MSASKSVPKVVNISLKHSRKYSMDILFFTRRMTYQQKKIFLTIFLLVFFLFFRGLQLQLDKSITDRIKFHAIPIAISVLYHHHPHDYTGLRSVALPFQGSTDITTLIKAAIHQDTSKDSSIYYWIADDRGFADYVITAFYLFGHNLKSMYYMWFLVLLMSVLLFLISFGNRTGAIGFLCLILLSLHLAISTLPLCNYANLHQPLYSITLYEPRFLDILSLIPIVHMMLLASGDTRLKPRETLSLLGQLALFIFLYHSRSSLGWQIVSVLSFSFILVGIRIYNEKNKMPINNTKSGQANIAAALTVTALLCISLFGLNIYKHATYNQEYFSETGGNRTFWHNALMGLGASPVVAKDYGLTVDDFQIANSVIQFARDKNKCSASIKNLEPQALLNSLGNYGVADWRSYEKCAKSFFFSIVSKNKVSTAKLYLIDKPLMSLKNLMVAGKNLQPASLEIGWHPLSFTNSCLFLLVMFFSLNALFKARKKLMTITLALFITSFIPSIIFYSVTLTLGGVWVTAGILFYLILTILISYILKWYNHLNVVPSSLHLKNTVL